MSSSPFLLQSEYQPTGDQPQAIEALCESIDSGEKFQTLKGVTGSGKTFTMANVIARVGKPTLVISHNKTLAAQLYAELKSFFPDNAVEYFVSYYDYYQPEAYIPQTDTFIEKDSATNDELERLRLAASDSLLNRDDVIVVASVSCIYGLGSPEDYKQMVIHLDVGQEYAREHILKKLVEIQYERNDYELASGNFRVRGDTIDVIPSYAKYGIRLDFWGEELESIKRIDALTGKAEAEMDSVTISPAKHFVMPYEKMKESFGPIQEELKARVKWFEEHDKLIEAQRIQMRTMYDIEMMREIGFCSGIENYSVHLAGRQSGDRPACLLDYFTGDFLTVIDESHVSLPQVRGMSNGDRARKSTLVEHGFRLPSALDNRPQNFDEFLGITGQTVFVSATPGPFEEQYGGTPIEQIIRPTGILDPVVEVRPLTGQIDDLMEEIRIRAERGERTLVTTLTKRTSEDLADYLTDVGLRVKYLHSEIGAIERVDILRGLRMAEFDALIGINLLREGLDLPEVSLVAILDADKEGFLRSATALIQTAGRAARNVDGRVILYGDKITDSMKALIDTTEYRRARQHEYNVEHGITPYQIKKGISDGISQEEVAQETEEMVMRESGASYGVTETIALLEKEMLEAADAMEFERAMLLRDQIYDFKKSEGIEVDQKQTAAQQKTKGRARYSIKRRKN